MVGAKVLISPGFGTACTPTLALDQFLDLDPALRDPALIPLAVYWAIVIQNRIYRSYFDDSCVKGHTMKRGKGHYWLAMGAVWLGLAGLVRAAPDEFELEPINYS